MSSTTRHWMFCCMVLALTVIPLDLLLVRAMRLPTDGARAQAWVSHLSVSDRAAAARRIGSLPVAYQRALYRVLPNERRARLWLDRVTEYETTHPGLNAAKVRCLNLAKDTWQAALAKRGVPSAEEIRRIADLAKSAFTTAEAGAIFGFGRGHGVEPAPPLMLDRISRWFENHVIARAEGGDGAWLTYACSCHVGVGDFCENWYGSPVMHARCEDTSVWCNLEEGGEHTTGCGYFEQQSCDGGCWGYPIPE